MDVRKVKKLIELLEESSITEIEITEGEESVRISRAQPPMVPTAVTQYQASATPSESPRAPELIEPVGTQEEKNYIKSPMVGIFYAAPSPDSDDFIKIGSTIKVGDTLCIIEAMKMMNQVEADTSGTVSEILIKNAEAVEFGQHLFVIS
jgi:acetyl-CoA carboxylase biotin carboxyl carrier protein